MDATTNAGAEQRTQRQEDGNGFLAPVATPEGLDRVQMDQIDTGPVDFVIKCTAGLFSGRFIYVNRTKQGELFGSDKSSKDITMYIENASLSAKHTEIKYNDQTCQYFLRDFASSDGTWLRIRWNRSVEIAPGQEIKVGGTLVEIKEGPPIPPENEVAHWLAVHRLEHLAPQFNSKGVRSLQDLRAQSAHWADFVSELSAEEAATLNSAFAEIDKMWPVGEYPKHCLEFVIQPPRGSSSPPEKIASVSWRGGSFTLEPSDQAQDGGDDQKAPPAGDSIDGVIPAVGWNRCEWLRIGYSFGRYYMHLNEQSIESRQKAWVRLRANQRHWLQPHDMFQIGTLEFEVLRFNAAAYSEQGFRNTMEDEEIVVQDLATSNWRHCSFFGVYDGHGGRECVSFIRQRLHMNFVSSLHSRGGLDSSAQVHHDVYESLMHGFLETDRQFLSMARSQEGFHGGSGSAAVVVCIIGRWVWCANLGDSRALLSRGGHAVVLSVDHKPDREDEAKRIEAAGGFVSFRRVLGRLAVSRAFGDEEYKVVSDKSKSEPSDKSKSEPLVIAEPEIRYEQLVPQDEFLFMACDGLFDVFSSQEAIDFIHTRLAAMPSNEQDPQRAVQDIVHEAIHERRSRDNVTALLVTFKRAIASHR